MKIGLYGGSFNPPHLGHLAAARAAVQALQLDELVLIPAGIPPHKALAPDSPAPETRLALTALVADQLQWETPGVKISVWDEEIRRQGKSYTADTLQAARERWPGAALWLLTGTDMFLTLHTWYHPEIILDIAGLCAFSRTAAVPSDAFDAQQRRLEEQYGARVVRIAIPDLVEVSSTDLRAMLPAGEGGAYLTQPVLGYILREHLYGTNADLSRLSTEALRCVAYSMVRAKRIPHIRGTEETAAALARRWGADEETARRAAILHDCTKYWTPAEHLTFCDQYGEPLTPLERSEEKLMHAKSGAAVAEHRFGASQEAASAIRYHTTGRGNMSLLEKIIYIADFIEPNRTFSGVESMREAAFRDLDAAVGLGTGCCIAEMKQRGKTIDPNTQAAYHCYGRPAVT